MKIAFTVNGKAHRLDVSPDTTLLTVLREAGQLVSAAAEPREDSIRASPFYKRKVLVPLTERAVAYAVARSRAQSSEGNK